MIATLIFTLVGCNQTDSLDPDSSSPAGTGDQISDAGIQATPVAPSLSSASFAGGIPMGTFSQPTTEFGTRYNGAKRNFSPYGLKSELAAIKSRGGRVVVAFAGNPRYFKDSRGHFDLDKWKARVARFKGIDFSSFLSDGTVIGHYLIDEPNDPTNWNGTTVSPATVEAMAQYSKQLWPNMATIARADPSYFSGRTYRYLDAAWAQYLSRRGDVNKYISQVTSTAQKTGLGLVVGLNFLKGGTPNGTKMTPAQVESWGSALLSSSYPCAFISWQHNSTYLSTSSMKSAMDALRKKAQNRSTKSCKGS